MPRYQKVAKDEWVQPRMKQYRAACCDCGLVHEIQFRVISEKTGKIIKGAKVQFNAARHPRATAAVRRKPRAFTKKEN